tara:strand:- start:160 stop:420 length:261 start_codon:yes stop_codon:yes gene_type:complete
MVLEVNNKPAPIKAENATFTDHTKKETKANLIPRALPPRIKMDNASLVPRFPGANDGRKVTVPNKRPTRIITSKKSTVILKPLIRR